MSECSRFSSHSVKYVALHLLWQPFSSKCPDAPLWHQPRYVIGVTGQPVDEAYDAHGGREEQHLRVEAQPGKVDPDPFTVVLPAGAFGTTVSLRRLGTSQKRDWCALLTWWGWSVALCRSREIGPSGCTSRSARFPPCCGSPSPSMGTERRQGKAVDLVENLRVNKM